MLLIGRDWMKTMKFTTVTINDILLSIVAANRYKNILTPEEIITRFPHAVRSSKYVNGKLKLTLHELPKSIVPFDCV
jgi:hypothetical protein